jgi:hypothetical protein
MSPFPQYDTLRHAICAIGYLTRPSDEYAADPRAPYFKIVGSGFLIAHRTVLTNRHVWQKLAQRLADHRLPAERGIALFAEYNGYLSPVTLVTFTNYLLLDRQDLDIAVLHIAEDGGYCDRHLPVEIAEVARLSVGQPLAVMGYPALHYERDTEEGPKVYRIGPVLQQGHLSAVAPFDGCPRVDRLLMDIRTGDGMSGSPVIDSTTGQVIGLHEAGSGPVTAYGIPITSGSVAFLLDFSRKLTGQATGQLDLPAVMRSV